MAGSCKCIKKGKFFSDNIQWSSKKLWKMMSANLKTDVKQSEKQDLDGCIL